MEIKPLEKREIRGLTLESLLKYGTVIISMILGFYLLKSKVDENTLSIQKVEKRLDAQEIKQNTDEIWKARTEEQLKNKMP